MTAPASLPTDRIAARDAGTVLETVFPARPLDLPNPLIYANFSDSPTLAWRAWATETTAARRIEQPPVRLVRYPPGTLVGGDYVFMAHTGAGFVADQVAPWVPNLADSAAHFARHREGARQVQGPTLLVARYGETTWGHWLIDILVRAVVAERAFPGRFAYAVPGATTTPTADRSYATAVLESLAAYGIAEDRLIRLAPGQTTRFEALHDVVDIWSDGIHPDALAALRAVAPGAAPGAAPPRRLPRIAALRRGEIKRALFNDRPIDRLLGAEGFADLDLRLMPFLDQVRRFGEAEVIVASLGSDCASAIFASPGTRVVTLSPFDWWDPYFTGLFQRLALRHADVRGASTLLDGTVEKSAHLIAPRRLAAGLAAADDPEAAMLPGGGVRLDGRVEPRRLGAMLWETRFGTQGNAAAFCRAGFAKPEPLRTWSLGARSTLAIPRAALPGGDLWLEIEGLGHVHPPFLPTRPLEVLANGTPVGRFLMRPTSRFLCRLEAAVLRTGTELVLEFLHPICPSPRSLGRGGDARELGFGFTRVALYQ